MVVADAQKAGASHGRHFATVNLPDAEIASVVDNQDGFKVNQAQVGFDPNRDQSGAFGMAAVQNPVPALLPNGRTSGAQGGGGGEPEGVIANAGDVLAERTVSRGDKAGGSGISQEGRNVVAPGGNRRSADKLPERNLWFYLEGDVKPSTGLYADQPAQAVKLDPGSAAADYFFKLDEEKKASANNEESHRKKVLDVDKSSGSSPASPLPSFGNIPPGVYGGAGPVANSTFTVTGLSTNSSFAGFETTVPGGPDARGSFSKRLNQVVDREENILQDGAQLHPRLDTLTSPLPPMSVSNRIVVAHPTANTTRLSWPTNAYGWALVNSPESAGHKLAGQSENGYLGGLKPVVSELDQNGDSVAAGTWITANTNQWGAMIGGGKPPSPAIAGGDFLTTRNDASVEQSTSYVAAAPATIALPQLQTVNPTEQPLRLAPVVTNRANTFMDGLQGVVALDFGDPGGSRPGRGGQGGGGSSSRQEELRQKLDSIHISSLQADGLPLAEVIKELDRKIVKSDPNQQGVHFLIASSDPSTNEAPAIDPATGLPIYASANAKGDLATATVRIAHPVGDITLGQALAIISKSTDRPIDVSLTSSGVVVSPKLEQNQPASVRSFKIDPRAFQEINGLAALDFSTAFPGGSGGGGGRRFPKSLTATTNNSIPTAELARQYFLTAGVSLSTNIPGQLPPITFDDRTGTLSVRATQADLELIEQLSRNFRSKEPTKAPVPAQDAAVPQPEISTAKNAFSTFSLNVSDVSFKLAAAALEKGQMPDPATVRTEEFINAFDYRDPEPKGSAPIAFASERARYPFAHNRDLLRFSIKTAATGRQPGRPLNLVLLLDNSGSMERADRVRIIQECLRVLAGQLHPEDRVSVVAFARTPRLWIDGLPGSQAGELAQRVGGLTPQGGTNLEEAMNLAYQTALRHFLANGINRVVLLTDGAANLGDVDPASLKRKVEAHRQQGIALDCFGIGWEGLNDDLLESLSRNGDGRYGFVNSPEAASAEFAAQLAGALHVAASDVKVQVEFNPRRVTSYRQIGYAKHQLKKEQFRDNTVDAAEIAAAEAGNALYTIETNPSGEGPLATVRVRFKIPGTADYREHEWMVPYDGAAKSLEQSSAALRLAAAGSAFSEWLVSSPFAGEVTPDRLLSLLSGVPQTYSADPRPKKLEWMVRQAKSLSGR
jgi:Mg-chelatase subunit ChlD